MASTTVGMDWGMAALGIDVTPRKAREIVVRAGSLAACYGEHAVISTISADRQHNVACLLGSLDSPPIAATLTLARRDERQAADPESIPADNVGQSGIIHSVHGVSSSGDWFLLADVGASQPSIDRVGPTSDRPCQDAESWLVVVGHADRDMINSVASHQAPTPLH